MSGQWPTVFVLMNDKAIRSASKTFIESVGLRADVFSFFAPGVSKGRVEDKPGCLVLDVRRPGASCLDFQGELAKAHSKSRHLPNWHATFLERTSKKPGHGIFHKAFR